MIRFTTGNLFDAHVDALINTVNLEGVMGKGIALQFKERFKNNFLVYKEACKNKTISIGNSLVVPADIEGRQIYIINFPTKIHWRNPSEYSFVERGLDNLRDIIRSYGLKSIAIPPLGAGNGGLEWRIVRNIIVEKLSACDCDIYVYEPGHIAASLPKTIKLTSARALLLYMLDKIRRQGMDVTPFSAVKAVYFLQKFGASDIFRMQFVPHIFGPYCDRVRHVLHSLDGAYICGFADMSKKPFEPFGLIDEKMNEVRDRVDKDIMLSDIVFKTCDFLDGYWEDFYFELISSVDYIVNVYPDASSDDVYRKLCDWSPRKRKLFSNPHLTEIAYHHIRKTNA